MLVCSSLGAPEAEEMDPPSSKKTKYHAEGYKQRFLAVFSELVEDLTSEGLANTEIVDGIQHMKEVTYPTH